MRSWSIEKDGCRHLGGHRHETVVYAWTPFPHHYHPTGEEKTRQARLAKDGHRPLPPRLFPLSTVLSLALLRADCSRGGACTSSVGGPVFGGGWASGSCSGGQSKTVPRKVGILQGVNWLFLKSDSNGFEYPPLDAACCESSYQLLSASIREN